MKTIIKEAPNYVLIDNKKVINLTTKKEVKIEKGSVRLYIDGKRRSFKIDSLIKKYEFKIKKVKEIESIKRLLKNDQKIQFNLYRSDKIVDAVFVSHSHFGDMYPAAKIRFNKKTKLISYLNIIL